MFRVMFRFPLGLPLNRLDGPFVVTVSPWFAYVSYCCNLLSSKEFWRAHRHASVDVHIHQSGESVVLTASKHTGIYRGSKHPHLVYVIVGIVKVAVESVLGVP